MHGNPTTTLPQMTEMPQHCFRQNMTQSVVQRSEQMAANIAAQMRAEGGADSVLLAKEPFDVVVSGG